jgi:hypothetical protein
MRTTIVVIVVLIAATAALAETPGNRTRSADEAHGWYQECLGNDTRAAEALQVAGGHVDHYCDMLSRLWQNGVDPEILARILLDMRREIDTKKTTENPPAQTAEETEQESPPAPASPTPLPAPPAPPPGSGTAIPPPPPFLRPLMPGMAMSPPPPLPPPPVVPGAPNYTRDPRYKHCTVTHPCWISRDGRITQ